MHKDDLMIFFLALSTVFLAGIVFLLYLIYNLLSGGVPIRL